MTADDDVMFQGKWIEEGANMIQPYSAKACTSSLLIHARLNKIVNTRLKQVKAQHHNTLKHAAGYLFLDGFLDATQLCVRGKESKKAQRQFIEKQRDEAVMRLQEAGIIPVLPPWFSLSWFVLRWVIVPFIQSLLEDYSSEPEKS
jgi:hypothetical protein